MIVNGQNCDAVGQIESRDNRCIKVSQVSIDQFLYTEPVQAEVDFSQVDNYECQQVAIVVYIGFVQRLDEVKGQTYVVIQVHECPYISIFCNKMPV